MVLLAFFRVAAFLFAVIGSTANAWELRKMRTYDDHIGSVTDVLFNHDGSNAYSVNYQAFKLRSVPKGRVLAEILGSMASLCDGLNDQTVFIGTSTGKVHLWNTLTEETEYSLQIGAGPIWAIARSKDKEMLATYCFAWPNDEKDFSIRIWDVASQRLKNQLKGHNSPIAGLAFTHDGKRLISGGQDRTIRLWNVAEAEEIIKVEYRDTPDLNNAGRMPVSISPDGRHALWNLCLWDVETLKVTARFGDGRKMAYDAEFLPDGKRVVSVHVDGMVRLWDVATQEELAKGDATGYPVKLLAVDVSPDGRYVLVGGDTKILDQARLRIKPRTITRLTSLQLWEIRE